MEDVSSHAQRLVCVWLHYCRMGVFKSMSFSVSFTCYLLSAFLIYPCAEGHPPPHTHTLQVLGMEFEDKELKNMGMGSGHIKRFRKLVAGAAYGPAAV